MQLLPKGQWFKGDDMAGKVGPHQLWPRPTAHELRHIGQEINPRIRVRSGEDNQGQTQPSVHGDKECPRPDWEVWGSRSGLTESMTRHRRDCDSWRQAELQRNSG